MSYFDYVVVDARKPLFLYHNKELFPLYRREKNKRDWVSYFDYVVVEAREPLFLYHNQELFPLYRREKIRKTGCPTLYCCC